MDSHKPNVELSYYTKVIIATQADFFNGSNSRVTTIIFYAGSKINIQTSFIIH